MRVLHVTPYFAPAFVYGGPPRSILALCRGLRQQGVDVDVMTTTAAGPGAELPASTVEPRWYDGVPARYFPLAAPRRLWNATGLHQALSRAVGSYDAVHIHGLWHRPGWEAARQARRAGVPYVISPRGMLEREALAISRVQKALAMYLIEERHLRGAAVLHATSRREAETLQARALGPRVLFAANGVDVAPLRGADPVSARRTFGIDPDVPLVMFLGRIHPIKRLDLLARAAGLLRHRDVQIVVAGPDEAGHRAVVAPMFAAAGVPTTWTGAVDGEAKAGLLAAASALVVCSDSESFGLSVAEAMAAGTPVVVTRTCPWEEVEREGAGYWVSQDPVAIAAALDEILGDRPRARAMGECGKLLVDRRYSLAATAGLVADGYRAIARSHAA